MLETRPIPKDLNEEKFLSICQKFKGPLQQIPPMVSAIKIDGKRLYKLAREGIEVDRPARSIIIHELEVLSFSGSTARLFVKCSKGTYIRSIARDLGIRAGSRAFCQALRRSGIGPFSVENASRPESVSERSGMGPLDFAKAAGIPVLQLSIEVADRLRGGYPIDKREPGLDLNNEVTLCVDSNGLPAALMQLSGGKASYRIVFD